MIEAESTMKKTTYTKIQMMTIPLMAVSLVLLCFGAFLMFRNYGMLSAAKPAPRAQSDATLAYDGQYINLISCAQATALPDEDRVIVSKVDTETGLPAAAALALLDKAGQEITRVNTVSFSYQGRPVLLSFTDDVADRYCYLDEVSLGNNVWAADPDALTAMLADYSVQASRLERG